jgi:hypothetical protein
MPDPIDSMLRVIALARATREAQKAYFRDRTTENLRASKALETRLDEALAEGAREAAGQHQNTIFDPKA